MKFTNSKLVTYKRISPHKTTHRNHAIDTISIHCIVGQWTAKQGCDYFATTDKKASANYIVGKDGSIGLSVEEKDRSWCTSSSSNDNRAVTIEVASDTTHPYAVTDKALEALIGLIADICKRNNIKQLKWKADKSLIGQVDKQNMTVHRWFRSDKSCPGDYLYNKHSYIAEQVNKNLGVNTNIVSEKPTKKFAPYMVKITASALNIRKGAGTNYGKNGIIYKKDNGAYTIVDEKDGKGATKWGLLKAYEKQRNGWVSLDFCKKI